jgi:anthraniloyl-CoA monooxygenase
VRIGVLGGGPAGLYFAALAKKADPSHEITLVERNAPDATFGWGVVFSEETLGSFRDADRETYLDITESFARWSAIDVHYAGKIVRSGGHVFSGVARKRLLQILQDRCRSLGVEMSFEDELADLSRFADGYDLIVAADGVNSTVRRLREEWFRPSMDVHRSKFVWFGTTRSFDAFTFIFRETEHGLFQVHAYPFDARTSTFIVECNQATWERAGLDGVDEAGSIAFCETLFAPELAGHRLISNRSLWVSFGTLRCESWHHGNVVLLGDAAHTAHFTIGSGTKLAMEDAISLANALEVLGPSRLEAALTQYELERQPVVERFQEAARESSRYFEDVIRYTKFDPLPFAFQLLTRSGRITHLELEKRDSGFVAAVDRWFAQQASGVGTTQRAPRPERTGRLPLATPPPPLLAPLDVGGVRIENRVVLRTSHGGPLVPAVGESLALEPGLVLTPFVAVSAEGRITPETPTADDLAPFVPGVDRVPVCVVLGHAGRRGSTRPRSGGVDRPLREDGWELASASPIPYGLRSATPNELDRAGMERVTADFVAGARRAAESGAGALLLECSRGYLLASFLTPLSNRRDDEFGGEDVAARLRFPLEVLAAVRDAWEGPLGVRYSATDWATGGLSRADSLAIARAFAAGGADFLDVVAGGTVAEQRPVYGRFFLVPYGDVVRNEIGIPTMTSGNITTADEVNTILAAGRADLVVLEPVARAVVREGAA